MRVDRCSKASVLGSVLAFAILSSANIMADECVPEGVENGIAPAEIPSSMPAGFPLPSEHFVMSANSGAADEYNPYPFAMVDVLTPGDTASVFSFYEKALAESGYRIVMWENDLGATGFRVRSDNIDQATISINSYDCRVLVGISVSLLP